MTSKKSGTPSPESQARANRQRIAYEEGLKAMADVEQQRVAARTNMARLRALREAQEAHALTIEPAAAKPKAKRKKPAAQKV